jgi:hypothetical protein
MIHLSSYVNKTIHVCIPRMGEEKETQPFKLVGVEEFGLWLEGEDLSDKLHSRKEKSSPQIAKAIFFPYSEIAYVLVEDQNMSHLMELIRPIGFHKSSRQTKQSSSQDSEDKQKSKEAKGPSALDTSAFRKKDVHKGKKGKVVQRKIPRGLL